MQGRTIGIDDPQALLEALPERIVGRIEIPKGRFLKRDAQGRVEYFSPLPLPFDYGCTPWMTLADGDLDLLVLEHPGLRWRGNTCDSEAVGAESQYCPIAVADFVDAGHWDPKLIVRPAPQQQALSRFEGNFLRVFFGGLACLKRRSGLGGDTWKKSRSKTCFRGIYRRDRPLSG